MNELDDLAELEKGLATLLRQEAEAEAALERIRDARKMQQGAVWWEQRRRERAMQTVIAQPAQTEGAMNGAVH